jgi:hypothetical protein
MQSLRPEQQYQNEGEITKKFKCKDSNHEFVDGSTSHAPVTGQKRVSTRSVRGLNAVMK